VHTAPSISDIAPNDEDTNHHKCAENLHHILLLHIHDITNLPKPLGYISGHCRAWFAARPSLIGGRVNGRVVGGIAGTVAVVRCLSISASVRPYPPRQRKQRKLQ
jgi:hypothetical protein